MKQQLIDAIEAAKDRMNRMARDGSGCVMSHVDYMYVLEDLLQALEKIVQSSEELQ